MEEAMGCGVRGAGGSWWPFVLGLGLPPSTTPLSDVKLKELPQERAAPRLIGEEMGQLSWRL